AVNLSATSFRRVREEFFKFLAGLEIRHALGLHIDRLAGFRVAATTRAAFARAETAEATQFDLFAFVERTDNRIKNRLDNHLGIALIQFGGARHFFYKLCFRHLTPVVRQRRLPIEFAVSVPRSLNRRKRAGCLMRINSAPVSVCAGWLKSGTSIYSQRPEIKGK